MKYFYVILWREDFNCWVKTHPNSLTLNEAKEYSTNMQNTEIIHEMWLSCLDEWPIPGYLEAQ